MKFTGIPVDETSYFDAFYRIGPANEDDFVLTFQIHMDAADKSSLKFCLCFYHDGYPDASDQYCNGFSRLCYKNGDFWTKTHADPCKVYGYLG